MVKWPWESVQDNTSVDRLTKAIEENNKTIAALRDDLSMMVEKNIESPQIIQKDISVLYKKTNDVEKGMKATVEGVNHMWYVISDPSRHPATRTGYVKRFLSWGRDFIAHHHLLIVSWFLFAATVVGAVYIFLSNTGGL